MWRGHKPYDENDHLANVTRLKMRQAAWKNSGGTLTSDVESLLCGRLAPSAPRCFERRNPSSSRDGNRGWQVYRNLELGKIVSAVTDEAMLSAG